MTITTHPAAPFRLQSPHAQPRTSGVHLSSILRRMALAAGKLPAKYANSGLAELMRTTPYTHAGFCAPLCKAAFGMAWEDWIAPHVSQWAKGMIHQPGELIRDDIRGTPDGISFDDHGHPIVHEFKFTYKSASRNIEEEWLWLAQICGYCAIVTTYFGEPCTQAYLHVAYAMGDYTRSETSGPCYRIYAITLSLEEIERAWQEIVANKNETEPEDWNND